ncbi:hypothetical protein MHF_0443 [Mycoplasma haemofelis Ohio2]|uniref:Uncharacterized protein n=1 Tax=Mycoplasma haemofelis (strain Ohio2) TaxID=859194 RepID=F6FHI0_MYCHI|nr:hypothetical protein MHF_0443 [Mycoplasma haemofelis Ohio2]
MSIWLLRLIPVAGSASVLAAMFPIASQKLDLDNTEDLFPFLEPIQPTSETTAPKPKNGRWTVKGVGYSHGVGGGNGVCQIYTGEIWSMGEGSLEFKSNLQKHDTIEKARSALKNWNGTVGCDSNRHFYVWWNDYLKQWEIRSSNSSPTPT